MASFVRWLFRRFLSIQRLSKKLPEQRLWAELPPDVLGLIFKDLSVQEKLTVVSMVCKPWGKVVQGPYCWEEIDIRLWSMNNCQPQQLDQMLRLLITRSSGSLRTLRVSCVDNDQVFEFIAQHVASLQTLVMQRSRISDSIVVKVAEKFSTLTLLDLSYCYKIGSLAFKAIGKNCQLLSSLSWNMDYLSKTTRSSHADEAHAIANTMPKLKRLELAYVLIEDDSVLEILSCCPELEFLDVTGCPGVSLDDEYFQERHPMLEVRGARPRYDLWPENDCSGNYYYY